MRRRSVIALAAAGVALVGGVAVASLAGGGDDDPGYREELLLVAGTREADGVPVNLDVTLYLPEGGEPAPAVLLAHGYGGTKDSLAAQGRELARRGYVALAYTARGFGGSGGKIHLDSPDYEVKDARALVDLLATRDEVRRDASGDPRVGVVGGSYGGALALLLAGTDDRVDAIVPSITWHDLRQALLPNFAVAPTADETWTPAQVAPPEPGQGVFKKAWAALLFGSGAASGGSPPGERPAPPGPDVPPEWARLQELSAACGRLDLQLCLGYVATATTGRPTPELLELLERSSPSTVAGRITAPTLLIQGQSDSLFPLSEADANAAAVAGNGTPVSVVWQAGGHDGGPDESERLTELTAEFLDTVLRDGRQPPPGFDVTVPDAVVSSQDTDPAPQLREAPEYPGIGPVAGTPVTRLPLTGGLQPVVSPPGATPAAFTSLPGVGGALGELAGRAGGLSQQQGPGGGGDTAPSGGLFGLSVLPGQAATFDTAPLAEPLTIAGAPRVRLAVGTSAPDATLFASVQDVGPDGSATLPRGLVSPVRLTGPGEVTVSLPAIVRDVPAGHRLRVVVSSTDQAYALPMDARAYQVALAAPELTVPTTALEPVADGGGRRLALVALAMLAALLLLGAVLAVRSRTGRRRAVADPELTGVPLAVEGLGKAYANGYRAVTDLTFRVEHGQVLGLLGPNGAGKTTTLRMLMGLIHPTEGEIRVFGQRITPGAPVLSRVGAFVEGPGFLPHLTGRQNLELFWQATGRPAADAHLAEALEVAGLGDDVKRTVRTYSQGMRQRLAIAQAMLGLPELLVLDEPTNGLDPPQIREMREVLARYAATGRTVVVSSHLLAEVEQTCSHVAVMHQGRLVAHGPVGELVEAATLVELDVDDPARAARIARVVRGVSEVERTPSGLVLRADGAARAELVRTLAAAGVRVERVAPQRGLEQTFLALVGER